MGRKSCPKGGGQLNRVPRRAWERALGHFAHVGRYRCLDNLECGWEGLLFGPRVRTQPQSGIPLWLWLVFFVLSSAVALYLLVLVERASWNGRVHNAHPPPGVVWLRIPAQWD